MKINLVATLLLIAAVLIVGNSSGVFSAQAQSAKEQLEKAGNTGTLFDGSDGQRFGTDTTIKATGNVPAVSPPAAVGTSSGTAGGYSVGGATTTAPGSSGNSGNKDSGSKSDSSSSNDKGSEKKDKTGSEPAR